MFEVELVANSTAQLGGSSLSTTVSYCCSVRSSRTADGAVEISMPIKVEAAAGQSVRRLATFQQ
jgi:hypothetical protein